MSSTRATLMFQLYILLCKMQNQTKNLDHDRILHDTILYSLEGNPSSKEQLAQLFSKSNEEIEKIINLLLEENNIKISDKEEIYILTYSGQKIVDKAKNIVTKYGAQQAKNFNHDEIVLFSNLMNKLLMEESLGRKLDHNYFS